MKKYLLKSLKIIGISLAVITLGILIIPFFIPVSPQEGLQSAEALATTESHFITIPFEGTDGIDIHYIEKKSEISESDTNFILLHGSLFNAFTWKPIMDNLSQFGNVYAYDQIPYGLSEKLSPQDWNKVNPYSSESQVQQLFGFIDSLNLENIVLVGNSYGGTLATQAALSQGEKIEKLILIDPAIYIDASVPSWILSLPQVQKLGPLIARKLGQSESFYEQTYFKKENISDEQKKLNFIGIKMKNWDYALWEYLQAWTTNDIAQNVSHITQPVLIIFGAEDSIVPISDGEKLNNAIQGSSFITLPQCEHVPQEECPKQLMESISSWENL